MKTFLVICTVLSAAAIASSFSLGGITLSKQIGKIIGIDFDRSQLDVDWGRSQPITNEQVECIRTDAASLVEQYELNEWFEEFRAKLNGYKDKLKKVNESSGIKKTARMAAFKAGAVKDLAVSIVKFPKDKKGAIKPVAEVIIECLKKPEFKGMKIQGGY